MHTSSRIFVAGHNGLVGSAIVKTLRARGYENLLLRSSSELDLRDPVKTRAFFDSERPDYVFLAAAKVGGIVANNVYRADFLYENLAIQNSVIHAAWQTGVKKLLFLGSTCIYPRDCPQPMREDYLLTSPLEYTNEPYAIAKIAGLKLCESFNLQYGTDFIAVMPTNLYGPNDNFDFRKSHVLPALLRKIHLARALSLDDWDTIRGDMQARPDEWCDGRGDRSELEEFLRSVGVSRTDGRVSVEIWGTGRPRREFLWSEDMADACVFVMERLSFGDIVALNEIVGGEVRNAHLNIGTGEDVSIEELARAIATRVGFDGQLVFNSDKPDGTMRKLTDPGRLNSLGWRHSVGIEEGIERLYAWYVGAGA
jgi:GDP-L-fucose synthase